MLDFVVCNGKLPLPFFNLVSLPNAAFKYSKPKSFVIDKTGLAVLQQLKGRLKTPPFSNIFKKKKILFWL